MGGAQSGAATALRCPFAPSALLSFIQCPYALAPIFPKCPFTPNSPYPPNVYLSRCPCAIVPIISPFAPVPICPKYSIVRDPKFWDPLVRDPNIWAAIIRDHLSWYPFVRDPNDVASIVRDPFSWCAFVLVPVCPGAHLSGTQMSENRLLHPTPTFDY